MVGRTPFAVRDGEVPTAGAAADNADLATFSKIAHGLKPTMRGKLSDCAWRFVHRLLVNKSAHRLGSAKNKTEDIKRDKFFSIVNWEKIERKHAQPPFVPALEGAADASYFPNFNDEAPDSDAPVEDTVWDVEY
mmetsp:Transcript_25086/g.82224  ORF Transcript_25086/g.82224 Transcript_25086/m.82224 type:complete len:134 (+) Transcript_25086:1-402(+)